MGYKHLNDLTFNNIDFKYVPFSQAAAAEIFKRDWQGSCNILSHDWMLEKISQDNLFTPTTYFISQPHLPHPVILKNNDKLGEDIQKVKQQLEQLYSCNDKMESSIEYPTGFSSELTINAKIEALLNYIDSKPFHYGVFNSTAILQPGNKGFSHSVSFVKRNDEISFFDPNQGEITFRNFIDFRTWFQKEAQSGTLQFLLADNKSKPYLELFPTESFTPQQIKENALSKQMNQIQKESMETKNLQVKVTNYRLISYGGPEYVNPKNLQIIAAIQNAVEPRHGQRAMGDRFDPSMKLAKRFLILLNECSKDQPLFDAMVLTFMNNYLGKNLLEKVVVASGHLDQTKMVAAYTEKVVNHFSAEKMNEVNTQLIQPVAKQIHLGKSPDVSELINVVEKLRESNEARPTLKR